MMGLDPKKMQAVMKQLGMKQEEIPAERVIIETSDKKLIINNPSVVKIVMQGQETFQISGDVEEEAENNSEKDIQTIMEKTECSKEKAEKALKDANGDLAEAIISLS